MEFIFYENKIVGDLKVLLMTHSLPQNAHNKYAGVHRLVKNRMGLKNKPFQTF